ARRSAGSGSRVRSRGANCVAPALPEQHFQRERASKTLPRCVDILAAGAVWKQMACQLRGSALREPECQFPNSPGSQVAIGGKKKIATSTINPNTMYGRLAA